MTQYYKIIAYKGDTAEVMYWRTEDPVKAHSFLKDLRFGFIIPLGNKKPRNFPKDLIINI